MANNETLQANTTARSFKAIKVEAIDCLSQKSINQSEFVFSPEILFINAKRKFQ